ncbi:RHS repeat domain-containing protein, partial [Achromobacter sp. Root83]|uniref:RHS repeat domain-containing protein n=1 Tax=Achromobacter sp. Root83 TaxID=1736602 RepID=UPI001F41FC91
QDPLWTTSPEPDGVDALAWYQCDHLGTPQELTDADGEIVWSAQYKAWGVAKEAISSAALAAGIRNPIRFQGQYLDYETGLHYNRHRYYDPEIGRFIAKDPIGFAGGYETGLHYNRHRYYDPEIGRFIAKDPIGFAGGLNVYQYADNPVGWVDPLGLSGRKVPIPRIEAGNSKEGWQHIEERHISGTHPTGAGDLFPSGTTQDQIQKACECLVKSGTRVSDPRRQIQTFEKRMKINGRVDRVRGIFDSHDGNRTITVFPVRSE